MDMDVYNACIFFNAVKIATGFLRLILNYTLLVSCCWLTDQTSNGKIKIFSLKLSLLVYHFLHPLPSYCTMCTVGRYCTYPQNLLLHISIINIHKIYFLRGGVIKRVIWLSKQEICIGWDHDSDVTLYDLTVRSFVRTKCTFTLSSRERGWGGVRTGWAGCEGRLLSSN